MSHAWGLLRKDKDSVILGSLWWGIGITLLIGVPLLLLTYNYGEQIHLTLGVIFILVIFPIITYSLYRAGCKKANKRK